MLDDEQYPSFSPYSSSLPPAYAGFDLEMKRAQDSIGGPDAVKKARYEPAYYNGIGQTSSPASLYNSNNAILANGPAMSLVNGVQPNGLAYSNNSSQGQPPPSPNSVISQQSVFAQQAAQQQQQQQQQFFQAQVQQQQQQQQQLNMGMNMGLLNGGMGLMGAGVPNMFNGMPMAMPFGFPMGANFQPAGLNLGGQVALTQQQVAAANAVGNQTGRTVYIGNLPADASVDELLNLVRFGPIESVRVLPEKSCVFISFLDGSTAAAFHSDATIKKLSLHGQELKIGWGKPSPVPSQVLLSITQSNASRNVYLGGLDESMTEEMLRDDLGRFGLIDQVKIVRDKNIGFVHFLSISIATKVVATLPTEPAWAGKRVNYGKDRCAYVPKSQQQIAVPTIHGQTPAVQQLSPLVSMAFPPFSPLGTPSFGGIPGYDSPTNQAFAAMAVAGQQLNRTVYLGNIHPETTTEDLCNAIRGGVIQSIRYMQDKHIAFVTFVDAAAAFTFHQVATYQGLTLNNRRLKVGWGKNSGPLSPALALSIHAGATRNVYVGNIEDFETFSVEKLKRDFGEYGDIELVNYLKEKNCAFVNFTNISNAIKAIDAIKNKPDYANLRIAHGKDRCANAPRSGPQGGGTIRRTSGAPTSPNPLGTDGIDGENTSDVVEPEISLVVDGA